VTQVLPNPLDDAASQPVTSVDVLVDRLARGCKQGVLKVGVEHEKFGVDARTLEPIGFDGPNGIEALLKGLASRFGYAPVMDRDRVVALMKDGAAITLEPGGQLELSGAPMTSISAVNAELERHFSDVASVAGALGIAFYGAGFRLYGNPDAMTLVPKARYDVMAPYLKRTGMLGLHMMHSTCTVQANLDFTSEADMGEKFQTAMAISSLVTALFAASPMVQGADAGRQSHRMHVWTDVDRTRCGLLEFALRAPPTFADYVNWSLDVPLIFRRRGAVYSAPPSGHTFRRWMAEVTPPTLADFDDLLSTLFPDVRLKTYLEVRSADCGPRSHLVALPALWKGLLYDVTARRRAFSLVETLTFRDHLALRETACRDGLRGVAGGLHLGQACTELVLAAQDGLRTLGDQEGAVVLEPLLERARTRRTFADELLAAAGDPADVMLRLARLC